MKLDDEVEALRSQLDTLEDGDAKICDWHRLVARAARVFIRAQQQLAAQPQTQQIRELMAELRIIRLCAEGRILEHEAERNQTGFSNWVVSR